MNEYCAHPAGDCLYADEFKVLRDLEEAARVLIKADNRVHDCNGDPCTICEEIWTDQCWSRERIDKAIKNLDEARRG